MTPAERNKQWRKRHPEQVQAYEKRRYPLRKEARRVYMAQWYLDHPTARQEQNARRKIRMGGSLRNVTPKERMVVWVRQEGMCGLCGTGMETMEIDHIIPLCHGGVHASVNVHLVHPACNRNKGQKLIE